MDDHRELVNEKVEEICITTRLLSLSSNKKFGASKQEFRNDLVKEKDNYPHTASNVLKFLHFHSLQADKDIGNFQDMDKHQYEKAFVTDGNKTHPNPATR